MAILRLSTGEVYTGYAEINQLIAPSGMEVGSFSYPDALQDKIRNMAKPLDRGGADLMFGEVSDRVEGMVRDGGFSYSYRRAGVFVAPEEQGGTSSFSMAGDNNPEVASAELTATDLANYMAPHILRANNWHFALSGAFVKGMQLEGDLQAMVYVTAGEWQRLDTEILVWVIFPVGEPVVGLSFFDRLPNDSGGFETDVKPDNKIHEMVRF